ncbi:hypothetical protein [uncultured Spirosoma sp.]|uniref:hypothetical protein n=1 Tax=uncultured Spirosoma sp. TaxID=278208 RepID=UPI00258AFEE1|nr:hypothetical protein [uncultured Spirosoma sp.]
MSIVVNVKFVFGNQIPDLLYLIWFSLTLFGLQVDNFIDTYSRVDMMAGSYSLVKA